MTSCTAADNVDETRGSGHLLRWKRALPLEDFSPWWVRNRDVITEQSQNPNVATVLSILYRECVLLIIDNSDIMSKPFYNQLSPPHCRLHSSSPAHCNDQPLFAQTRAMHARRMWLHYRAAPCQSVTPGALRKSSNDMNNLKWKLLNLQSNNHISIAPITPVKPGSVSGATAESMFKSKIEETVP